MKPIDTKAILDTVRSSFVRQFDHELDIRLLNHVVIKEIQKKKEAFLQVQISSNGLGINELLELKNYLKEQMETKSPNETDSSVNGEGRASKRKTTATSASLGLEGESDSSELSEDELKKIKQREYARHYYQRKKAESAGSGERYASKRFKTTPEQRAYQRAYYKRRKKSGSKTEGDVFFQSGGQAREAELFADDKKSSSFQVSSPLVSKKKSKSVNYDALAADFVAIDNAFRSETSFSMDSVDLTQNSRSTQPSGRNGTIYSPRTKLRKAK